MAATLDSELKGISLIRHLLSTAELRSIVSEYEKAKIIYERTECTLKQIAEVLNLKVTTLHNYLHNKHQKHKGRPSLMDDTQIKELKDWIKSECRANKSKSAKLIGNQVYSLFNLAFLSLIRLLKSFILILRI